MKNTFSEILANTDFSRLLRCGENPSWESVFSKIGRDSLSLEEFAALITDDSDDHLEILAGAAKKIRAMRFGNAIKIYAPLYISNECVNKCSYCNFNSGRKIRRITLSLEESLKEADSLLSQGHRHILLVAGENPAAIPVSFLEKIAKALRPLTA